MSVSGGAVRQVWFAPVNNPSAKVPYLIRDDAYSKKGVDFGRTIRLGEPVNLGPRSTWRQLSWEGGFLQENWRDEAMYHDGQVDTCLQRGRIKMWPGWRQIAAAPRRAVTRFTASNARTGGFSIDRYLYLAECSRYELDPDTGTDTPPGGAILYRYDPSNGSLTQVATLPRSVSAMIPHNDEANPTQYLALGLTDGRIYFYKPADNSLLVETALHPTPMAPVHVDSLVAFKGGLYWGGGRQLWRRTATRVNPTDQFTVKYEMVKDHPNADSVRGCTVWNNRLYYATVASQVHSAIHIADGLSVVEAFTMPGQFEVHDLQPHYGALYISGNRVTAAGGIVGEIWRYTGGSLTKLWTSSSDPNWIHNDTTFTMVSWNEFLVWTRNGHSGNGNLSGVYIYDAEMDAILTGPLLPNASGAAPVIVDGLFAWGNTFVTTFNQLGTFNTEVSPSLVAAMDWGGDPRPQVGSSFSYSWNNVSGASASRYLVSSSYDGDVSGEEKTWLTVRVRCRLQNANEHFEVRVILDDNFGTEYSLGTVTYDAGNPNWRTVSLPVKASGEYLRSQTVRYKVILTSSAATGNPEIDAIEVDWMVAPAKRREWRLRIMAWDAQELIDGTAHPLTTVDAQRTAVEALWADRKPVLFWDAQPDNTTPVGAGTEVFVTDFLDQPYVLDSTTGEMASELSVGLLELV